MQGRAAAWAAPAREGLSASIELSTECWNIERSRLRLHHTPEEGFEQTARDLRRYNNNHCSLPMGESCCGMFTFRRVGDKANARTKGQMPRANAKRQASSALRCGERCQVFLQYIPHVPAEMAEVENDCRITGKEIGEMTSEEDSI